MRTKFEWGWAVALLLVGTGWALLQLFEVSTRGGEAYPQYSSLRADPMGTKALHDSLAALPGYRVERSFKERFRPAADSVVFVLDVRPDAPILEDCRRWAVAGARVVVGLQAKRKSKDAREGALVYVDDPVLLSNEGLQKNRNSALLLTLLGGRRHVVFEESHLGVVQSGSVGQLLRRYRLGGAAFVLLVLAALFFWRSSSSSLPEVAGESKPAMLQDDALVSLVRGAIPAGTLGASALSLWSHGGGMLKSWSAARRHRVEQALQDGGPALAAWNRAHEILKRNST